MAEPWLEQRKLSDRQLYEAVQQYGRIWDYLYAQGDAELKATGREGIIEQLNALSQPGQEERRERNLSTTLAGNLVAEAEQELKDEEQRRFERVVAAKIERSTIRAAIRKSLTAQSSPSVLATREAVSA